MFSRINVYKYMKFKSRNKRVIFLIYWPTVARCQPVKARTGMHDQILIIYKEIKYWKLSSALIGTQQVNEHKHATYQSPERLTKFILGSV